MKYPDNLNLWNILVLSFPPLSLRLFDLLKRPWTLSWPKTSQEWPTTPGSFNFSLKDKMATSSKVQREQPARRPQALGIHSGPGKEHPGFLVLWTLSHPSIRGQVQGRGALRGCRPGVAQGNWVPKLNYLKVLPWSFHFPVVVAPYYPILWPASLQTSAFLLNIQGQSGSKTTNCRERAPALSWQFASYSKNPASQL